MWNLGLYGVETKGPTCLMYDILSNYMSKNGSKSQNSILKALLNPKCPSLSKCVLTIEKGHWLVVIPSEAKCVFS